MRAQRRNALASVLALTVVLATPSNARAQWGFPGISGQPGVSQLGLGYGSWTAYGTSPYDNGYGSFTAAGYVGSSNFVGFPLPGFELSSGQVPLTTASFPTFSSDVTLVPGWSGSGQTVRRQFRARPRVGRAANRR
jgi:hypothetical protein